MNTIPSPPPRPTMLPNPCDGLCNAPLVRNGVTVGYCGRMTKEVTSPWRRYRAPWHRGPHRIEWNETSR